MPASEHVVNASKLASNLGLINPMSPDDSTARNEFEAIAVDELTSLLDCVDEHSNIHSNGSDELLFSPERSKAAGKRKRSFGSDDDNAKEPHTRMRTYTARKKQQLVNSCLRDTAHRQQLALARVHSALSDFTSRQEKLIPFDNLIHLSKDRSTRLQTLLNFKPRMLRDARRFMRERTAFMDLSVLSSEQSSFVSPSGDYCALKFVVMPLEGDLSARQVFDTIKFYLVHMEIMISEATGDVTLCEEEDPDNQAVSQHRFLRSTPSGYQVESNDVIFSHFDKHNDDVGDGREYGIIVIDCVDKDELHPYSPDRKLRQDLTSVLTVQTYKHKVPCSQHPKKKKTHVVMTRSNFFKLHHTSLPLSKIEMQETIDRLACRGNLLFNAVRASVSSEEPVI